LKVVRDWRGLADADRGAAVAIGNFDGVHRGHAQVIAAAAEAARATGAPLAAAVFDPHPRLWFQPGAQAFRLTTDAQRARALANLGVEILYALPFEAEMAGMTDAEFAARVLAEELGARHVAAGFDFSFGKGRTGDGHLLRAYGERFGFGVSVVEAVTDDDGRKLSSTAVRLALEAGRPRRPPPSWAAPSRSKARWSGAPARPHPWLPYRQRPARRLRPPEVRHLRHPHPPADGRVLNGVSNIGENPTVGGNEARLEAWLFDFDADIYGRTIETELVAFLRPEENFPSVEALTAQVHRDAEIARKLFAGTSTWSSRACPEDPASAPSTHSFSGLHPRARRACCGWVLGTSPRMTDRGVATATRT
jgi:riboflavin kinase/FMN adenylyltransferase